MTAPFEAGPLTVRAMAAFFVDAKYLGVEPRSQVASGPPTDLRWNPLLVSAGFGFRF